MSIVSSKGILVNKDWMSNEAIYKLVILLRILFENESINPLKSDPLLPESCLLFA